jgi:hypothetical protein
MSANAALAPRAADSDLLEGCERNIHGQPPSKYNIRRGLSVELSRGRGRRAWDPTAVANVRLSCEMMIGESEISEEEG